MNDELLSFSCSACDIRLTVPRALAGVVGPCPSCGSSIEAPHLPAAAPPQVPFSSPVPDAPRDDESGESYPSSVSHPESSLGDSPEMRGILPPISRPGVAASQPYRPARRPSNGGRLSRPLTGILLVLLCAAIVAGVVVILRYQKKLEGKTESKPTSLRLLPISSENETRVVKPAEPKIAKSPLVTMAPPEPSTLATPIVTAVEEVAPASPAMAALAVLEKFLAATTLAERLPLMETKTPEVELATSILRGPLPELFSILIDAQEQNSVEEVTDIYYNVNFAGSDAQIDRQTILMRIRGSAEPKVVADPFLDSLGGRLLAYLSRPADKTGVFQVIVSALASCNNLAVPSHEKKLTLKLLAREDTKEIAQAYFGRQSKISAMLEDGSFRLSYGRARPCTVLLRWNLEENPAKPYLEVLDIQHFDWNP